METDPNLAIAEAPQGLSAMERIRISRLGIYVTAAAASLSIASGGELTLNPEPVAADNLPAPEAVSANPNSAQIPFVAIEKQPFTAQTSSWQQKCINAGLKMPTDIKAYMTHPGQEAYNPKTGESQPSQSIYVAADYSKIHAENCNSSYERTVREDVQIKHPRKDWRRLVWGWQWVLKGNGQQHGKGYIGPTGHEPESYYWQPGVKFRATFENLVTNLVTGKTVASKEKSVPVRIGHK